MELNLVAEGLKFMVLGMVTVFLFLILMVIVLKIQSKLVQKFFPVAPAATSHSKADKVQLKEPNDEVLVAVISAAIKQFRKKTT